MFTLCINYTIITHEATAKKVIIISKYEIINVLCKSLIDGAKNLNLATHDIRLILPTVSK